MSRESRRKALSKATAKAISREAKKKERNLKTLESILRFLKGSIDNPKQYVKTVNRVYLLRCMGCIMDSIVYDIDTVLPLSDFDTPSRNLVKKINDNLDVLLGRLRKFSISAYGEQRKADGMSEDSEYDDLAQVAYSLQELMEYYLIYFIDPEDHWRLTELDKFFKNIVPDSAVEAKAEDAKQKLIETYGDKIKMLEAVLSTNNN